MLRLRIGKPLPQKPRRRRADVRNGGELLLRCSHERVKRFKMRSQHLGRLLPHLTDTERAQQPRQTVFLALFQCLHQILRRFFAHPVERRDRLRFEVVKLRRGADQSRVDERFAQRHAEAVHRVARSEMRNVPQPLRRAFRARAAQRHAVLVADDRRAALRATLRHMKRHGIRRALVPHDGEHLRNDLARLLHQHRVADAQIELVDEILIVQRGVRHRRPGQTHGVNDGLRRQHAGAAHLHHNIAHTALLFLRRVLIGHRPARELRRAAERFALRQTVDLDDRAVDVEGIGLAVVADPLNALTAVIQRGAALVRHGRKAERLQVIQRFGVCLERAAADKLEVKNDDVELACSGDLRVLLADGAGRGVAGIGQQRLAAHLAQRVDLLEHLVRHIDLAAHDQALRRIGERHRQVSQRTEIFRHVLADKPVAARRAADEHTVFIFQRHGQPVDLRLHNIVVCLRNRRIHAFAKGAQLVKGKHVLQTLQRHRMAHLRKRVERISAHALRRRIR